MRGNRLHVDETKRDKQRPAALAKGGKAKMLDGQAVASARAGVTGPGQTPAPGKLAKGGKHPSKFTPAKPAKPGATSAR